MTTLINFHNSEQYRAVLRTVQLLPTFDRIQISLIHNIPFGSVSRILAEFKNEGYIESTGDKASYTPRALMENPDFKKKRINYGNDKNAKKTSEILRKTKTWPQLLKRWKTFLEEGPVEEVAPPPVVVKPTRPPVPGRRRKYEAPNMSELVALLKPPSLN